MPDRAQLSFGVSSDAKTASAALRANAAEMTKVIAAIKGQGIAAADIRTELVSLSPRYTQNGEGIVGYTATNSVGVTLRNLDKTGGVIDAAVDAGANQVSGPNLVRSDQSALYRPRCASRSRTPRRRLRRSPARPGLASGGSPTYESGGPPPITDTTKAGGPVGTRSSRAPSSSRRRSRSPSQWPSSSQVRDNV